MTETETPVVIRDVFPAEVTYAGQVFRTARAIVTRDRVLVYLRPGEPVLDGPYDPETSAVPPISAPRGRAAHLTLLDGEQVHVNGQRGCGCGNPLKGWTPWQPYRKGTA